MEFISWPAVRAPCNRHLEFGVTLLETLEGNCQITFFDAPLNAKQNRHPARPADSSSARQKRSSATLSGTGLYD